jgi:hypothetical protein
MAEEESKSKESPKRSWGVILWSVAKSIVEYRSRGASIDRALIL